MRTSGGRWKVSAGLRLIITGPRLSVRSPRGVMWLCRKGWLALRRGGIQEVRTRLLGYASRHPQTAAYDEWVRLYDTLTPDDRSAIWARVGALTDRPLISVLMPVYETPEPWLRGVARAGGVERARVRRLLAEVWAELAVALTGASRRDDRAAAYAAVRAILHGRSHVGRRMLLGLAARGIVGWQTTARQTISGGRGSAGRGAE